MFSVLCLSDTLREHNCYSFHTPANAVMNKCMNYSAPTLMTAYSLSTAIKTCYHPLQVDHHLLLPKLCGRPPGVRPDQSQDL